MDFNKMNKFQIPMKDLDGIPYDISTKMVLKTIQGDDYWTTSHYVVSQGRYISSLQNL